MDVFLVYAGLVLMIVGFVALPKPLNFLGIRSRRVSARVLGLGLVLIFVGVTLPARDGHPVGRHMRIDDFMPVYQFNEVHSIRVHAPPDRIFHAIKAVTPQEIRFFRTLTWIRSLPARLVGKGRTRSRETRSLVEVTTRSGFLLLAEETDQELVLGTTGQFWKVAGGGSAKIADPQEFVVFDRPGFAKAALNFHVENESGGWCRVTTETRILATDPAARRKFAAYWRVIYPGSALIRRMWLRAVKQRAEGPDL